MNQSGYVRLVAASVAAISLHALLFSLLPAQQELVQFHSPGSLQIELLAQQEPGQSNPVQNYPVQTEQEKVVAKAPAASLHEISDQSDKKEQLQADVTLQKVITKSAPITVVDNKGVIFIPVEKEPAQEKGDEVLKPVEAIEATQSNDTLMAENSIDQIKASLPVSGQTTVIPQHIQADIIARVHYPRQARRRGWQGEAQFLLNINAQSIQAVTMLASTGYPILDRAAQRGLSNVNNIPLSNGLYHMPVSFRLQ